MSEKTQVRDKGVPLSYHHGKAVSSLVDDCQTMHPPPAWFSWKNGFLITIKQKMDNEVLHLCRCFTHTHTARACAVETHVKISQEPLGTEIFIIYAADQNRGADFVRACGPETHVKISQEFLWYGNLQGKCRSPEWALWSSTGLYTYRKNPSVWTHCLGKMCWSIAPW